jgi:predicted ATPase
MITRIVIDGFKTFRNFKMEFSPLTIIAGPNASGKSNLFDALQLLSRLAETDLRTAFSEQRGEAIELFTQIGDDYVTQMKFEIEMLVNRQIQDNWGSKADLKYTRLIYALTIQRSINGRGLSELSVIEETLNPIRHDEDRWVDKYIPKTTRYDWRPKVKTGKRGIPYIATELRNGIPTIVVPQDGRAGIKREIPIQTYVSQTVLSSFSSVDFPHIFAAREEMRNWRFLQLNPEVLRRPSPYLSKDTISSSGENLAAVLHRVKQTDSFALPAISRRLNNLLPNLTDVDVIDDAANKQFVIKVKSEDGREFSSRVLSEGTLRLLTLCIFQYDERSQGLICFEEPENGIHPFRINTMVQLLKDLGVDFADETSLLRQVVVNTHSPNLVAAAFTQISSEGVTVWLSQLVTQIEEIEGTKRKLKSTRLLPIETNQSKFDYVAVEKSLTLQQAVNYLQSSDLEAAKKQILDGE